MRNICAIKMCNTKILNKKKTVSHTILPETRKQKNELQKGT